MKIKPTFYEESGGDAGAGGGGGASTLLSGGSTTATTTEAAATTAAATTQQQQDDSGSAARFDFRAALDDNGAFKPGWEAGLPADMKESAAALAKYPNPEQALRGLVNAQKLIGAKTSLKPPAPDAPAADVEKYNASVRDALGIPAKIEDYKLTAPASLPEGVKVDDAQLKEFSALAHSLNITPSAAQKLMEFDMKRMAALNQSGQAKLGEFVKSQGAELQTAWGDKMQENIGIAKRTAEALGLDVNDPQLGNNAAFVKAMFSASKLIQSDKLIGTESATGGMTGSAGADDIRNNKMNPWHNAYHGKEGATRQQEALAVMKRLNNVK